MSTAKPDSNNSSFYVCPSCKGALESGAGAQDLAPLQCPVCKVDYPILDGIPNFMLEDFDQSNIWAHRNLSSFSRVARIYETGLWYTPVLKIYGGRSAPNFRQLIRIVLKLMTVKDGVILDAACGPGTWGRRIAPQSKEVYGIDISWGMLGRGLAYTAQDHVANMHFARSKVETLPFPDACFDAAFCGGALHLFPDTVAALREIGRTLKPGAPLVVMTFTPSSQGILRFRRLLEYYIRVHGFHPFELPVLDSYLTAAGFRDFQPQAYGSVLILSARKG